MPYLFLFCVLGLTLAGFREGVWKRYTPLQLAHLRARGAATLPTAPVSPSARPIVGTMNPARLPRPPVPARRLPSLLRPVTAPAYASWGASRNTPENGAFRAWMRLTTNAFRKPLCDKRKLNLGSCATYSRPCTAPALDIARAATRPFRWAGCCPCPTAGCACRVPS